MASISCPAVVGSSAAALALEEAFVAAESLHPWLLNSKLVVKPDQLIKRRGKNGLLGINLKWDAVKDWIRVRAGKPFKVRGTGKSVREILLLAITESAWSPL